MREHGQELHYHAGKKQQSRFEEPQYSLVDYLQVGLAWILLIPFAFIDWMLKPDLADVGDEE